MELDSETLFNTAAAAVAVVAVVLFVLDHQFPYSPVSKAMIVIAFCGGVFALSQRTDDAQLTVLCYGVVVISVVALVLELTTQFDVGGTLQVVALLTLALVLFGLRTRLDERNRFVAGRRASRLFAALAVLAVVVVTVDVVTGGLAYELQTQQQVQVSGDREPGAQLGSVAVSNPGLFPHQIDIPRYGVCTAGNWSSYRPQHDGETRPVDASLRVDREYGEYVFGFGEARYPAVVQVHAANVSGEQFGVERTERCPDDESGDPYLAVFERSEDNRYPTPV